MAAKKKAKGKDDMPMKHGAGDDEEDVPEQVQEEGEVI